MLILFKLLEPNVFVAEPKVVKFAKEMIVHGTNLRSFKTLQTFHKFQNFALLSP